MIYKWYTSGALGSKLVNLYSVHLCAFLGNESSYISEYKNVSGFRTDKNTSKQILICDGAFSYIYGVSTFQAGVWNTSSVHEQ